MEYLMKPTVMLMLVTLVTMGWEALRFRCFLALGLGVPGRGGHRYTYYADYSMTLPLILPMFNIFVTIVGTLFWRRLLALPAPWNLYINLIFLLLLFCFTVLLFYKALGRVVNLRESAPTLLLLAAVTVVCFVVQPLRFVFGGTLLFVVTLALSQTVKFTGWHDLAQWLQRVEQDEPKGPAEADAGADASADDSAEKRARRQKKARVRVRLFLEAEGSLVRRGQRIAIQGEDLAEPTKDIALALAQRVLDEARLTRVIAAQEELQKQKDLLAEIPGIVARNVGKLAARQEALSQSGGSTSEKEEGLQEAAREILDEALGERMRSLLYWSYDLPQEKVLFFANRTPRIDLKPIITFEEYLGSPLSWYERSRRAERRGARARPPDEMGGAQF